MRRSLRTLLGLGVLCAAIACTQPSTPNGASQNGGGGGQSPLGAACTSGASCVSGLCAASPDGTSSVCSECAYDPATGQATCGSPQQTCTWDASAGYRVCQGPTLTALGGTCSDATTCASGYCFAAQGRCSSCAKTSDCGTGRDCVYDAAAGYASCVGIIASGQRCNADNQCRSGFCHTNICSECDTTNDCTGGGTCSNDTTAGYWTCTGGLGDPCNVAGDCALGHCYDNGSGTTCSQCNLNSDCGVQQHCTYDPAQGYASCQGIGQIGDGCNSGDQCASTHCHSTSGASGVCSECAGDADCGGASGSCVQNTTTGAWACLAPLGASCSADALCQSGHCTTAPVGGSVCSTCSAIGDCDVGQDCTFDPVAGYATCRGTLSLGANCTDDAQCTSGFCNTTNRSPGVCSACDSNTDCASGSCVDDTDTSAGGTGYFLCSRGLGRQCASDTECTSGHCYGAGSGNGVCSNCIDVTDCPTNQACTNDPSLGYATCQGAQSRGENCSADNECTSGYCNTTAGTPGVCSDCDGNADCGGGTCTNSSSDGYFVCVGGLGNACSGPSNCDSGYCFDTGNGMVCSDCTPSFDCGTNRSCTYQADLGYATCVGTLSLGQACQAGQCAPGSVCNSGTCSECATDGDCGTGGSCVLDSSYGYWTCKGGLGQSCQSGYDCTSGQCYSYTCSQCDTSTCPTGQTCAYNYAAGYGVCSDGVGFGAPCNVGPDCQSGICNNGSCSNCSSDADCGSGTCVFDATYGGYDCTLPQGQFCLLGSDCSSGYCYLELSLVGFCSDCASDQDCPGTTRCTYDPASGYATCK